MGIYKEGMNLRDYRNKYDYHPEETLELFGSFAEEIRKCGYLTRNDLMRILLWKADRVVEGDESKIRTVTESIFKIDHQNENDVRKLLEKLTELKGVQIPVASAILSILFPDKYGIFDRNTRYALEKKKYTYSVDVFLKYTRKIRQIAKEQNELTKEEWHPRDVDKALWVLGRGNGGEYP